MYLLMWLSNKPFLHIVYTETWFQYAVFIKDKTATSLWNYFVNCTDSVYTETIQLGKEKRFTSNELRENTNGLGIELIFSRKEAHK